jgi:hypothetical protein
MSRSIFWYDEVSIKGRVEWIEEPEPRRMHLWFISWGYGNPSEPQHHCHYRPDWTSISPKLMSWEFWIHSPNYSSWWRMCWGTNLQHFHLRGYEPQCWSPRGAHCCGANPCWVWWRPELRPSDEPPWWEWLHRYHTPHSSLSRVGDGPYDGIQAAAGPSQSTMGALSLLLGHQLVSSFVPVFASMLTNMRFWLWGPRLSVVP